MNGSIRDADNRDVRRRRKFASSGLKATTGLEQLILAVGKSSWRIAVAAEKN